MFLIRPFLFIQKQLQRHASIGFVRYLSRWSELLYSVPKGLRWEINNTSEDNYEWLVPEGEFSDFVIIYLHGGFVFPLYNPTRYLAGHVARETLMRTLLVDFRIAPEHPFPAAIDDCAAAYLWLINEGGVQPEKVFFVGESAGGNLAVAAMLSLRDAGHSLPAGAVLISPVLDFEGGGSFYTQKDLMADPDFVMRQLNAYRGEADPRDPLLSPIYADLGGLPPLLIQVGSEEILRSGAEVFAERAIGAGVPTTLEIWPGMWHYWHIFLSSLPQAQQAMAEIADFLLAFESQ